MLNLGFCLLQACQYLLAQRMARCGADIEAKVQMFRGISSLATRASLHYSKDSY